MCGRGQLFPDTEQPPQNAPHAAGRTPHHDLHALTSCHASTPRRRRSAETPPETSGTPPETRRRSGCPVPAPARRSPETSFRRHIVARYIPPLLQYMKERTRRAWRAARRCFLSFRVCRGGRLCPPVPCHSEPVRTLAWESVSPCLPLRGRCQREALTEGEMPRVFLSPSRLRRQPPPRGSLTARRYRADGTSYPKGICSAALHCRTPSPTRGSTYRPAGRGPRAPPKNAYPAAGHMGPALQVHTPPKKTTRRPARGAARFPSMCGTDGGGLYSPLLQAGTAGEMFTRQRRCTRCRCRELRKRPCSRRPRSWCPDCRRP